MNEMCVVCVCLKCVYVCMFRVIVSVYEMGASSQVPFPAQFGGNTRVFAGRRDVHFGGIKDSILAG